MDQTHLRVKPKSTVPVVPTLRRWALEASSERPFAHNRTG